MTDVTYDDQTGARFERVRLTGASFEDVYLDGATFHDVDLRGASLRQVDLRGLRARDVWLEDVDITGDVENLVINGVDVAPAHRGRARPPGPRPAEDATDRRRRLPRGLGRRRAALGRHRRARPHLPARQLHERVDGEWSFIETLRHLVFATDAWVCRALLGDPEPWDALDLPHDDMPDSPPVPRDREARPSLDEVLALRADRMATVRRVVDGLTDEALAGTTEPVPEPGYPEPESYAVTRILRTILNEEWQHRLYAERDLDALAAGAGDPAGRPGHPCRRPDPARCPGEVTAGSRRFPTRGSYRCPITMRARVPAAAGPADPRPGGSRGRSRVAGARHHRPRRRAPLRLEAHARHGPQPRAVGAHLQVGGGPDADLGRRP